MKKLITFALSFAMLLSSAVFAAPAPVATENVTETVEEAVDLQAIDSSRTIAYKAENGTETQISQADFAGEGWSVIAYDDFVKFYTGNSSDAPGLHNGLKVNNGDTRYVDTAGGYFGSTYPSYRSDTGYARVLCNQSNLRANIKKNEGTGDSKFRLRFAGSADTDDGICLAGSYKIKCQVLVPTDSEVTSVRMYWSQMENGTKQTKGYDAMVIPDTNGLWKDMEIAFDVSGADNSVVDVQWIAHGGNGSFQVDNIVVLYQAPVTEFSLTFNANGVETTLPANYPEQDTNFTVNLSTLARPVAAGKVFKGWSETAGGAILSGDYVVNGKKTLYANWYDGGRDNSAYSDKGDLLFYFDFENRTGVGNGTKYNYNASYWNTAYCASAPQINTFTEVDGQYLYLMSDGNKYVEYRPLADVTVEEGAKHEAFANINFNNKFDSPGVYTLIIDYFVPAETKFDTLATTTYVDSNNANETVSEYAVVPEGTWCTVEQKIFVNSMDVVDLRKAVAYLSGAASGTIAEYTFAIDSVAMYYDSDLSLANKGTEVKFQKNTDGTFEGIRCMAGVMKDQKTAALMYGFIVTRKTLLTNEGLTPEEFTYDSNVAYVEGICYDAMNGAVETDLVYIMDGVDSVISGVLTGITEERYNEVFVVRSFAYYDGDIADDIVYGTPVEISAASAAASMLDNTNLTAAERETLTAMAATAEV